jgi:prophage DNA circulation protein
LSWRDSLVDGSFKNISFKISSHDYNSGRRTQLHQFANREKPFLQDLGLEAETFTINAYIIQNIENSFNYFTERDDLIRVLKKAGSGNLVHPFLGMKKVGCTGFSLSENFDEGGIAKFTINFTESGERALPENLTDFFSAVDNAVDSAMDMVGDAFNTAYSTVALFQDSVSNVIGRSVGTIQSALSLTSGIATKLISESVGNVALIRNSINDIINSPNDIFNALKNCCLSMGAICGMSSLLLSESADTKGSASSNGIAINDKPKDIFANKITLSTNVTGGQAGNYSGVVRGNVVELDPNNINEVLGKSVISNMINLLDNFDYSGLGASPAEQEKNIVLLLDTFKFQIIATICRIAIRINFYEQEDAVQYMKNINTLIDSVLLDLGNEAAQGTSAIGVGSGTDQIDNKDIFLSIQDIRKVFCDNMNLKISGIAKGLDYRIPVDIETTLELSYKQYGDLSRSTEIYNRNKKIIQHPGFMPNTDIIRILNE